MNVKILLVEEISFSEIDRLYLSINKLEEFEKSGRKDFSKIIDFCDIVGECKRGRNISYLKCWWKYNKENIELDDITLDKVLKFKKEGDSDYLLKLGELLIRYIDEKSKSRNVVIAVPVRKLRMVFISPILWLSSPTGRFSKKLKGSLINLSITEEPKVKSIRSVVSTNKKVRKAVNML